jgi:transposase
VVGSKGDGRKVYSREVKRAVVQACLDGEGSVAGIALQIGVNANVVRRWIDVYRANGSVAPRRLGQSTPVPKLLAVEVGPSAQEPTAGETEKPTAGSIEISRAEITVWLHGAPDRAQIEVVLDWLARRP